MVMQIVVGAFAIIKTTRDCIGVVANKEVPQSKKAFQICVTAFSEITQVACLFPIWKSVPGITRLSLDFFLGAGSIGQRIGLLSVRENALNWKDYCDVGGDCLFRTSNIARNIIVLRPDLVKNFPRAAYYTTEAGTAIGNLALHGESAMRLWENIKHIANVLLLGSSPIPEQSLYIPLTHGFLEHASVYYSLKQTKHISELNEIPKIFHWDPVFRSFKCPLSKKPIRHLSVVLGTEHWLTPVYYEQAAIGKRLEKNSKPLSWPERIPFSQQNLRPSSKHQKIIDARLYELLEQILQSDIEFGSLQSLPASEIGWRKKFFSILTSLSHLKRLNEMSGLAIEKLIKTHAPEGTLSNVSVATILHKFSKNEPPQPTKAIRLQPTPTFFYQTPLTEEELHAAARAILFFKNRGDKNALLRANIPFTIFISTDYKNLQVLSEFVRPKDTRVVEVMQLLKATMQLENLSGISNMVFTKRLLAKIPVGSIANLCVRTIRFQFSNSEHPKLSKAIHVSPLRSVNQQEQISEESLYASARHLFGSQSEIDRTALLDLTQPFIIYVSIDFQDVSVTTRMVKPISERKAEIIQLMKSLLQIESMDALSNRELSEKILVNSPKGTFSNLFVISTTHQFSETNQAKPTKAIHVSPLQITRQAATEDSLYTAAEYIFASQSDDDQKVLLYLHQPFVIYVSTDFQNLEITAEVPRSKEKRIIELLQMIKASLQLNHLSGISNKELSARILQKVPKDAFSNLFILTVQHKFGVSAEAKLAKAIHIRPRCITKNQPVFEEHLFAATESLFGSLSSKGKHEWANLHRPYIIYLAEDLQNLQIMPLLERSNLAKTQEIIQLMQTMLQVTQLNATLNRDLTGRILEHAPKGAFSSLFVRTVSHRFFDLRKPKPSKAIYVFPLQGMKNPTNPSEESLLNATEYIFGLQSEKDKMELMNLHSPFVIFVSTDFEDLQVRTNRESL